MALFRDWINEGIDLSATLVSIGKELSDIATQKEQIRAQLALAKTGTERAKSQAEELEERLINLEDVERGKIEELKRIAATAVTAASSPLDQ